jgi:hypothetical protein
MITYITQAIQPMLLERGYFAGTETSLQITQSREPDIWVFHPHPPAVQLDYTTIAAALEVDTGIKLAWEVPELESIRIYEAQTGELITLVEIVSPTNKTSFAEIQDYQDRRRELLAKGVNVVEIDLTRSVKRLTDHSWVNRYPYHLMILLPSQSPRLIGIGYGESLKRFALPLRTEVIPVDLHTHYQEAYQAKAIAVQILNQTQYTLDELPFPSQLTDAQKQAALDAIHAWQTALARLKSAP